MAVTGTTVRHHSRIWHCIIEEEERFSPVPFFSGEQNSSPKAPQENVLCPFDQGKVTRPLPNQRPGNRNDTIRDSFNLSWFTTEPHSAGTRTWIALGTCCKEGGMSGHWVGRQQGWSQCPSKARADSWQSQLSCHFCEELPQTKEALRQISPRKWHHDLIS